MSVQSSYGLVANQDTNFVANVAQCCLYGCMLVGGAKMIIRNITSPMNYPKAVIGLSMVAFVAFRALDNNLGRKLVINFLS